MKKLCVLVLCFTGWMVYAQDDSTVGDKVGKAVDDTVQFFSDVFSNSKDFVNSLDTKKLKLDFQALSNRLKRSIDAGFTELKNITPQDSPEKLRRHLDKVHRAMDDFIQKTSNEGKHRQDIDRILQDAKLQIRELKKKAAETGDALEKSKYMEQAKEASDIQKDAKSTRRKMLAIRKNMERQYWQFEDSDELLKNKQWLKNLQTTYDNAVESIRSN